MDRTQRDLDLYFLTRNVIWRYELDDYEFVVVEDMKKTVRAAIADVQLQLFNGDNVPRGQALLDELEALSAGLRKRLGEDVADMATEALNYSAVEHQAILSINGAASINTVALSAEQFRAFMASPATGGVSLPAWVDAAWGNAVTEQVKRNLNIAVLQGESYQNAVRGLLDSTIADFTEREAVTIARTYIQTANVAAQMAVYQANDDLVKGWRWSAVLEPGYAKTGRGTCLVCAARDGREYPLGGGPPIPAHPRCRCVSICILKTWRELGIDSDEIEAAIRPYTIRPDANIDAGGMRTIIESGRHQGDYASWWAKQSPDFRRNAVGPGRFELLEAGKIRFEDLVDGMGRQRTLGELMAL